MILSLPSTNILKNYLNTDHHELFNLSKTELDKYDKDLFDFLNDWKSNRSHIKSLTSGSTGKPKVIELFKNAMLQSALATNSYFKLDNRSAFLICLPIKHIAGKMMILRAINAKAKIILTEPNSNPVKELSQPIDFCAMTPHQVMNCFKRNKEQLNLINNLIIGGSPVSNTLSEKLSKLKTNCFVTFGMTETISHIAIKEINALNNNIYECLPHVNITSNDNNQLIINAPIIGVNQLVTNDVISYIDKNHFTWIGRLDNIINSGGIKIHPELIEKKLELALSNAVFFIDQVPHKELGSQLIIIIDHSLTDSVIKSAFKILNKYEIPKIIYRTNEFFYSGNNKVNRLKTKNTILK